MWTVKELRAIWGLAAAGAPLCDIGPMVGRTAKECDIALYALLGRPWHVACEILNSGRRVFEQTGEPGLRRQRLSFGQIMSRLMGSGVKA